MMRPHRAAHRILWPFLALVIVFGFLAALALRPPPEPAVQLQREPRK